MKKFCLLRALGLLLIPAALALGQTKPGGMPWHYGPATILRECEGDKCNGTWTIHGQRGSASWVGGPDAILVVTEFAPTSITLRRLDYGGSTIGLTALYKGVITGQSISGTVTWTCKGLGWPNDQAKGKWSATVGSASMEGVVAESPITPSVNTVAGPFVFPGNLTPITTGADGIVTDAKAILTIANTNDKYTMVHNHWTSPLIAYSTMISYGGLSRHYYYSAAPRCHAAPPGNAIIEQLSPALLRARLLAAVFADGSTFGDLDEVIILMAKIEAYEKTQ